MSHTRILTLGALGVLALGALGALVVWRGRSLPAQTLVGSPSPSPTVTLADPESHRPACDFWGPWQRLVAPGTPEDYLKAIKVRLDEPSARSGEYLRYIDREHSVLDGASESICIRGRFTDSGTYELDAGALESCREAPPGFLDLNVEIRVERLGEGGFINEMTIAVGLAHVTPEGVLAFLKEQGELMRGGYQGWSAAFPAFHALNLAGFGPVAAAAQGDGSGKIRYAWLTQPLRGWQPKWADYLMQLSDLVSLSTALAPTPGPLLLSTRVETLLSGIEVTVPQAAVDYLAAPATIPLTVAHDVNVRFRGLEIKLFGMKFSGELTPAEGALTYVGRFAGVDRVELGGAYRGFSGGAFGKMIQELVAEKIQEEVQRLTTGNGGKGWVFDISHATVGEGKNVFTYKTSLQSPVNFLNLVRQDKDSTESTVLPDKSALQGLNRWSAASVEALIKDAATCPAAPY